MWQVHGVPQVATLCIQREEGCDARHGIVERALVAGAGPTPCGDEVTEFRGGVHELEFFEVCGLWFGAGLFVVQN